MGSVVPLFRVLSWRYLSTRKLRTASLIFSIALGVAMILGVELSSKSILGSYHRLLSDLSGRADLQVTALSDSGFHETVVDQVAATAGVKVITPVVKGRVAITNGDKTLFLLVYGIDPATDQQIRDYTLVQGSLPPPQNPPAITITEEIAKQLKLGVGDSVELLTPADVRSYTVTGVLQTVGPGRANAGLVALLELTEAQDALLKHGLLDSVDLVLEPGANPEEVKASLSALGNGEATVGKPVERGQEIREMLLGVQFMLYLAAVMSVFVGLFMIFNNVTVSMKERRTELGILRSLGMRRNRLFLLVLAEALGIGLVGAVLGIGLGTGLAQAMATGLSGTALALFDLKLGSIELSWLSILKALVYGLGGTLLAAYVPAREALTVQPIEAVVPAQASARKRSIWRVTVGLTLLGGGTGCLLMLLNMAGIGRESLLNWGVVALIAAAIGLVAVLEECIALLGPLVRVTLRAGLGLPGRLAYDNLARVPARTAATAAGLVISIAFMIGLSGYTTSYTNMASDWVNRVMRWDLRVSTGIRSIQAMVPLSIEQEPLFQAIDGVAFTSPQRFVFHTFRGDDRILVGAFRMTELPRYVNMAIESGPSQAELCAALHERKGVAITTVTAHRYNLKLGDLMHMDTPSGAQDMPVLAVLDGFSPDTGEVHLDYDWYAELWMDHTVDAFVINLESGADVNSVREGLKAAWPQDMPMEIQTAADYRNELIGVLDSAFMQVKGLVALTAGVALLGIINTMMVSIMERQREIAVLRAVGARRMKIAALVLAESLGVGIYGAVLGSVAGIGLFRVLILWMRSFSGLNLSLDWPYAALVAGVATALIVAPLAGLWPARRASRQPIVPSLKYE